MRPKHTLSARVCVCVSLCVFNHSFSPAARAGFSCTGARRARSRRKTPTRSAAKEKITTVRRNIGCAVCPAFDVRELRARHIFHFLGFVPPLLPLTFADIGFTGRNSKKICLFFIFLFLVGQKCLAAKSFEQLTRPRPSNWVQMRCTYLSHPIPCPPKPTCQTRQKKDSEKTHTSTKKGL